jgi:hypothetical protein
MHWWFYGAAPAELLGTAIIIALFVYEVWIQPRLKARKRFKELADTFELRLPVAKLAPSGSEQSIFVSIVLHHTTTLNGFNVRFVRPKGPKQSPDNVDPNIIRLNGVVLAPGDSENLNVKPDGEGGYDCEFVTPYYNQASKKIRAGKTLDLRLPVIASVTWSGALSFQALDADDNLRSATCEFVVAAT